MAGIKARGQGVRDWVVGVRIRGLGISLIAGVSLINKFFSCTVRLISYTRELLFRI